MRIRRRRRLWNPLACITTWGRPLLGRARSPRGDFVPSVHFLYAAIIILYRLTAGRSKFPLPPLPPIIARTVRESHTKTRPFFFRSHHYNMLLRLYNNTVHCTALHSPCLWWLRTGWGGGYVIRVDVGCVGVHPRSISSDIIA